MHRHGILSGGQGHEPAQQPLAEQIQKGFSRRVGLQQDQLGIGAGKTVDQACKQARACGIDLVGLAEDKNPQWSQRIAPIHCLCRGQGSEYLVEPIQEFFGAGRGVHFQLDFGDRHQAFDEHPAVMVDAGVVRADDRQAHSVSDDLFAKPVAQSPVFGAKENFAVI